MMQRWSPTYFTEAAIQAILTTFGATDGWAIINATDKYLLDIAFGSSDGKQKALALASHINEDPMMVCSLGLQPMGMSIPVPVRLMYGDYRSYINTGKTVFSRSSILEVQYRFRNPSYTGNHSAAIGGKPSYNSRDLSISFGSWYVNSKFYIGYRSSYTNDVAYTKDANLHTVSLQANKLYNDGTLIKTYTAYSFTSVNLAIYRVFGGGGDSNGIGQEIALGYGVVGDARGIYRFLPCLHNGGLGMYCIDDCTFYPNAGSGSFAVEYGYMQNGSWVTWTPTT